MNNYARHGGHRLGVAAVAAMAASMATAGAAGATPFELASFRGSPAATAMVADNTLTITGTDNADVVALRPVANRPDALQVVFGAEGSVVRTFNLRTFNAISVSLRDGNDRFAEPPGVFADKPVTVHGGNGDDVITTGDAKDVIYGDAGNDTINSGGRDDLIFAGSGTDTVIGGPGHDTAFLGSGQDSFLWNPGDGSDVVDGGSGIDRLDFNGSSANEIMSLTANGSRAVFLRDVGKIEMDLNSIEDVHVVPLGGADQVTVNDMRGTDVRQADIDLSAAGVGDRQVDHVIVNGTDRADSVDVHADGSQVDVFGLSARTRITGSEPTDHLQLNTLGGDDEVNVARGVSRLIGVTADLGSATAR